MPNDSDFSNEEVSRRRDEVVRQMANTPPHPKTKPDHLQETKKKADTDHAAHKVHAHREGSTET